MTVRASQTLKAMVAIATMACSSSGSSRDSASDTPLVDSTRAGAPAGAVPESANVSPSTQAPAGRPSPATTPAATASPSGKGSAAKGNASRAPVALPPTHEGPGPEKSAPAPGVQTPQGASVPAYVVFRDSVGAADIDWLKREGFTIEKVFASSHSVSLRMPADYAGNPKSNPRVLRFNVAMR
jgi:hypothetical protein